MRQIIRKICWLTHAVFGCPERDLTDNTASIRFCRGCRRTGYANAHAKRMWEQIMKSNIKGRE